MKETEQALEMKWHVRFDLTILLIVAVLVVLAWVVESVIDSVFFYERTFLEMLLTDVPPHEVYTRILRTVIIVTVGAVVAAVIYRYREVKARLQETGRLFKLVTDSIDEVFFIDDPTFQKHIYVSPSYTQVWGRSVDHLLQKPSDWLDAIHPEDRDALIRRLKAHYAAFEPYREEFRLIHPDKGTRWIQEKAFPREDGPGGERVFVGVATDVTELKQAEIQAQQQASWLQTILDTTRDGFLLGDAEGRIQEVNDAYCDILGYTRDELLNMTVFDLDVVMSEAAIRAQGAAQLEVGGQNLFETQQRRKDGSVVDLEISSAGTDGGLLAAFVRDITERKRFEQRLVENDRFISGILRAVPSFIYIYDLIDDRNVFANEELSNILGWTPEELQAMGSSAIPQLIHPDDLDTVRESIRRVRETSAETDDRYKITYRLRHKDSGWRWIQDQGVVFRRTDAGEVKQILGAVMDVTPSKEAQDALQASEEKYRLLVENQSELVVKVDPEGWFLYVSQSYCETFGKSEAELLGSSFIPLVHEDDREHTNRAMESLYYPPHTCYIEQRALTVFGWRWIAWADRAVLDADGNVKEIIAVGRDVTARKEAERRSALQRDLAVRLNSLADQDEALNTVLDTALALDGVDAAWIYLLDSVGDSARLMAQRGVSEQFAEGLTQLPTDSTQVQLALQGQPVYDHYDALFDDMPAVWPLETLRAVAVVPIQHDGRVLGALTLASRVYDDISDSSRYVVESITANVGSFLVRNETREALRRSEERLRSILENTEDAVWSIALPSRELLYMSPMAEQVYGETTRHLQDDPRVWLLEVVHPYDRDYLRDRFGAILREGTGEIEYRIMRSDDSIRWIQDRIWVIYDAAGQPSRANGISRDVTQRRQAQILLEHQAERLHLLHEIDRGLREARSQQELVESTLANIMRLIPYDVASVTIFDGETGIGERVGLYFSERLSDVQITTFKETVFWMEYMGDDLQVLTRGEPAFITDLQAHDPVPVGLNHVVQLGIRAILFGPMILEGKLIGTLNLASLDPDAFHTEQGDIITEIASMLAITYHQNQLNRQIREYAETLEQRVKERTAELETANVELQEFAYVISHDLKAPLRAIVQLSNWIVADYQDILDDEGKDMLQLLVNRTRRMNNLIEGVLQYSRIGRITERQRAVDLNKVLSDTLDLLAPPETIHVDVPSRLPHVFGEETRIQQLFQNLLGNAIQYMDKPEGHIRVEYSRQGEMWQFRLSDNGPGIDEKYHHKVFQLFQSLSVPDERQGTGIGLALVKRIVKTHGGSVWLTSTPGEGCTFTFTLPVVEEEPSV